MLNLIKPGHVLRFGTDPGTIISPPATNEGNDNTLETAWTRTSDLGAMQCLSHPSGALGSVAAQVVGSLRTTPGSKSRSLSYSTIGRAFGSSNRLIGVETCSFVGYVDGQTNYIESNATVFSKDFSGCLMVAYLVGGRRRVAHAAASSVPAMDCKRAFLKTIRDNGATLIGWFQPFIGNRDNDHKIDAYQAVKGHIKNNINKLVTFGVVTRANDFWSVEAFRPEGQSTWVVTHVAPHDKNLSWDVA